MVSSNCILACVLKSTRAPDAAVAVSGRLRCFSMLGVEHTRAGCVQYREQPRYTRRGLAECAGANAETDPLLWQGQQHGQLRWGCWQGGAGSGALPPMGEPGSGIASGLQVVTPLAPGCVVAYHIVCRISAVRRGQCAGTWMLCSC